MNYRERNKYSRL